MTDTNQKLREAFESRMTDNGKWPNAIKQGRNGCYLLAQTENAWTEWQACAEALALPTADHLPDAGKMINGLTQAETDASASVSGLTAAPVDERERFEQFAQNCPMGKYNVARRGEGYDSSHTQIMWDAWQARAALSAGDAGWQPIETAPKDGENIWAFNGEQGVMHWIDVDVVALWVWEDDLLSDADPEPVQPTHWMPLPPPPSAIRARGEAA